MDDILDTPEKNFYLNLREFANGEFEAVLRVVRPLKQEQIAASIDGVTYAQACAEKGETSFSGRVVRTCNSGDSHEKPDYDKAANHSRAVRRAKQNIRWLCKAMDADRLFTLTTRENQNDRDKARAHFSRFVRLVRSGWRGQVGVPGWQFVAVLELQERGAYHIHCAVRGFQRIKFLRAAWYKALGGTGDETGDQTPGAVNVTNPDKKRWGHTGRQWKVNKLVRYLTKYLSKTFDESASEKKRYWHNRDVRPPEKQRFWVSGNFMSEAILSAWALLELHVGLTVDCSVWVSTANDVFFIAGAGT